MSRFITFEGGEGAGKSTQITALSERLRAMGRDVAVTREPGGTPEAEEVRSLLVNGDAKRWSPEAEALLNYAARDHHLRNVIRPALANGAIVLCDRFMDSTRVYQGYAGGCPMRFIDTLETTIVGETRPHLTLIFDLDPEVGLARAAARSNGRENRYESKGLAHHALIRDGFRAIAKAEPERCRLIDASMPESEVARAVWNAVKDKTGG
ncbi:MAG: dTMP kinase [Rhizobiales bacterium]|nr:dTMP kinase [Hyphomicrobiales bacterium]